MSLYSLPCLQEVDGITVLWGVRGAAGLFPCEGMTNTSCTHLQFLIYTMYILNPLPYQLSILGTLQGKSDSATIKLDRNLR